ncbi:Oligopeptide transporter 2 [Candida viswanathii]|uniref:Oligopeptide transporter 2 n=1 Tax=Candida viswanathii TaxID=5486 RepID=A0A367Y951_9ASCO|nr:Oligopeptide transporter 2 [Candida viswanathii]
MSGEKVANVTVVAAEDHISPSVSRAGLNPLTSSPLSIGEVGTSLTEAQKDIVLRRLHFDGLTSFESLPREVSVIFERIDELSTDEAVEILKVAIKDHETDVNVSEQDLDFWKALVANKRSHAYASSSNEKLEGVHVDEKKVSNDTSSSSSELLDYELENVLETHRIVDWGLQVRLEAALIDTWSPYAEVRAVTVPYDDPEVPVETFRVYLIGILWTAIGAVINQFFTERQPSITLAMSVVQVFLYPSGLICEWVLPKWKFKVWRWTIDLNPGPYTFKEQMLATIFCGVTGGSTSYVSYNILMQKSPEFYDNQWVDWGYQILLILSTNFMGVGLAGIMRKFAVYPVKAVWPSILPGIALNKTLLTKQKKNVVHGWAISSYRFFFIVFAASFVYFWVPNYLFQALSTFNWMTWIAPSNQNLAVVTGFFGGLGLNPISTFDWNIVNMSSPLNLPFYTIACQIIGSFLAFFAILGVWYTNYKWTAYLPINSNALFTNKGTRYQVGDVVNIETSLFDNDKYQEVGPPFYSAANLVLYGSFFALYPFHFVYEIGIHYREMWDACQSFWRLMRNWKNSTYDGFDDPHSKLMRAYPEVPEWAYLVVLVISLVLAILCVKLYPAQTPVWGIFFALGINFIFLIPLTTIYARTGFAFGLNVLVELIIGYILPGNGLALALIKALGYNIDGQAQNFVNDLKQGHYAKLPPRAVYRVQILSIFIASFIQLAILNFQITGIRDYCDPKNTQKFTCPSSRTFFSASVLWGTIGPKKVFGGLYPILEWCFLIGFLAAFPCIALKRWGPKNWVKKFEPSIIIGGFLIYAPYNLSYYLPGVYVSFTFMYYIRNKFEAWWQKYNYILSTGLTAGIAFCSIIMFFAVLYTEKDLNWWGNSVPFEGVDFSMTGWLNATVDAPDGYFGPRIGEFP